MSRAWAGTIDPVLAESLRTAPADRAFPVIVRLRDRVDVAALHAAVTRDERRVKLSRVIRTLREKADASQQVLKEELENREKRGGVTGIKPFWIFNGIALSATADNVRQLAARNDVLSVALDRIIRLRPRPQAAVAAVSPPAEKAGGAAETLALTAATSPTWNLDLIGARTLWSQGFRGQGVVVASLDTGVDVGHPALGHKWRGGSNSWFDPYRQTTAPYDVDGHGTGTMGVMVAGNTTDNPVGVAPGALWIAAKIFDDSGNASLSVIHQAFQWVLNPDGDPASADAPDVVNNSWDLENSGTYDNEFEGDIQNLQAAGISVVFAAGNGGPQANSSTSPGNNPGGFPVGATDSNDLILPFSSRGPSPFDGSLFPAIVAPGYHIHTTDLRATYSTFVNDGTSYAAPHVSGAIALLLSGRPPSLTGKADGIQNALTASAWDLGGSGPDNVYGYGRLDVAQAAALISLQAPSGPTGDVNGDGVVDIQDALIMLQAAVGAIPLSPLIMEQGDVAPFVGTTPHPDGAITIIDVLGVLRKAVGLAAY
ncbi:S8 family serine peptidase [Oryzomonas japonica]|uniref:S8 family serine peptidase n=1 Tax=Oryzomonas japonica TaxID=2603858 RepID=UPI001786AFDF|nr:S8 family serine peptidase [Oryzomonas japonica]